MTIQYITDLTIPASKLNEEQKIVRKFYLVSAQKIWGVKLEDEMGKLLTQVFDQWKGWLNENYFDPTRLDRVKRLTDQIEATDYKTDPNDNRLKQVWERFIQTFETQAMDGDLSTKTIDQLEDLAENPYKWNDPKIQGYEGGVLPVGLLTQSPYLKDPLKQKDQLVLERDQASVWREMRFMEFFINIEKNGQAEAKIAAANRQEATWRWIRGENVIWNRTNVHYNAWIGEAPREITQQVDYSGLLEKKGMQAFVAAHRLPSGAEVLSIAILPKKCGEQAKVSIQIPSRWGAPQISAPQDMFRFLEGTCKENQGVIIYGRRLELAEDSTNFRPDEPKYRQSVNPEHESFHIYDNLTTADTTEFTAEVLKAYGDLKKTKLETDFVWGTEVGTFRLMADMAKQPENRSPFVLMAPTKDMDALNAHWSYLGPWMGVGVDYKSELVDQVEKQLASHTEKEQCTLESAALKSVKETLDRIKTYKAYTRLDVETATNMLENAKKLPEVKGRKVLLLREPKLSYFSSRMTSEEYAELKEIMISKGYEVTMVQPKYTSQENGYRYYPNLKEIPEAQKWFETL